MHTNILYLRRAGDCNQNSSHKLDIDGLHTNSKAGTGKASIYSDLFFIFSLKSSVSWCFLPSCIVEPANPESN